MEHRTTRIFGYDLIKTIAIFLIVFYHLGGVDYGEVIPGEYYLPNLAKFFSAFIAASVPLFLMVNGALIIPRKWTFRQAANHSARLIFLYVFWKLLLQEILCKGIFGIEEEMVHFWFLRTLAIIYLLIPLLNKFPIFRKFLLRLLLIFPFFSNFLGDLLIFFRSEVIFPPFAHSGFFTLYAFLYFYLGWMLKDFKWQSWKCMLAILIGLLLVNFEVIAMSNNAGSIYDGVNSSFPTIGALVMSVGIYQLLKNSNSFSTSFRKSLNLIGTNTLGVFIFHVPLIFLIRYFSSESMDLLCTFGSFLITLSLVFFSIILSYFIRNSVFRFLLVI